MNTEESFPVRTFRSAGLAVLLIATVAGATHAQSSSGVITTVAGNGDINFGPDGIAATSLALSSPRGIAVDGAGNYFISDVGTNRVRKVAPDGVIETIAGQGTEGFGGDGGSATLAQLFVPAGLAVDVMGNLLIADSNNGRVRSVSPDGIITTVAGNGSVGFGGDGGPATAAEFSLPSGVALDGAGNLFVADTNNHQVRKITPAGIITIAAGDGTAGFFGDGEAAVFAQLFLPVALATDSGGNLFIVDSGNSRIRRVTPAGIITTFAGMGTPGFSGDGTEAVSAELKYPNGIAIDAAGNLFISDTGNNRIRRVTPAGIISTVAGDGTAGAGGDRGWAVSAQLDAPLGLAVDAAGNLLIADSNNGRVRKITFSTVPTFSFVDRGASSTITAGLPPAVSSGFAGIRPADGEVTPPGLAIFGFRQNNILVSEAGVPAAPPIRSGRIYAAVSPGVNTGLAIGNPNSQPATVAFYFTNQDGDSGHGTTTIAANGQIAAFLDGDPFNGPASFGGSFTFSSPLPVAVIALRGLTNEQGEFLMTTLPLADLDVPPTSSTLVFPHFADGDGWSTQIILVNPADTTLSGTLSFRDTSGQPSAVNAGGEPSASYTYVIPPRSSQKLQTTTSASALKTGSVLVVPDTNTASPSGLAIFSYRKGDTTVAEAGVPAVPPGTSFRLYAEVSGTLGDIGSIQTGVAIVNTSPNPTTVSIELSRLDGSSTGLSGTLLLAANSQVSQFLNSIPGLASLETPFQGVVRLSSPESISVTGLRGRYNERRDFLITTTPAVDEATASTTGVTFLPQIADGGGYTTQFIMFSGLPGQTSSGTIDLFTQDGGVWSLDFQQ